MHMGPGGKVHKLLRAHHVAPFGDHLLHGPPVGGHHRAHDPPHAVALRAAAHVDQQTLALAQERRALAAVLGQDGLWRDR